MKKLNFTGLLILLSALMLFLSGCSGDNNTGGKMDPFLGGTTGISVDFASGAPPPEAFDGGDSPFDVVVVLQNKGEHDVQAGEVSVKIKGILASDFSLSENDLTKQPEEELTATEKNSEGDVIDGPQVYVEFTGFNHDEDLNGNTPFTLMAEVCYIYETTAQAMLCVKEDNLDTTTEGKVCTVNEMKNVYNSGGPVQIENFKEYPAAENKVRFTFDVVHKGTGDVYKKATTCDKDLASNENKIWMEVTSTIGGGNLKCNSLSEGSGDNSGYVRLYSQDRFTVTCTQEVSTNSDYETPININLLYDYEQTKSTQVLVKHLGD